MIISDGYCNLAQKNIQYTYYADNTECYVYYYYIKREWRRRKKVFSSFDNNTK